MLKTLKPNAAKPNAAKPSPTKPNAAKPSPAKPNPSRKKPLLRRRLQHLNEVNGVHFFTCKSMTRLNLETVHTQEVDMDSGHVRCSCEHHMFRHAMHEPTLSQPHLLCKHLEKCAEWLERQGLKTEVGVHRCVHCGMPNAEHGLCDDDGNALPGHICTDCTRIVRMMGAGHDAPEPEPVYEPEVAPGYEPEYLVENCDEIDEPYVPCPYCNEGLECTQTEAKGEVWICDTCGAMNAGFDAPSGEVLRRGVYE